jgi:hypothetical protein
VLRYQGVTRIDHGVLCKRERDWVVQVLSCNLHCADGVHEAHGNPAELRQRLSAITLPEIFDQARHTGVKFKTRSGHITELSEFNKMLTNTISLGPKLLPEGAL